MKKLVIILILIGSYVSVYSGNEMKLMDNVEAFKNKLSAETQKINTIQSDFEQIKHLAVFNEDMTSYGKFYYQKEDKLSLIYTTPVKYVMTMNGNKIRIASDGKENVYDIGANKSMKEMREVLSACMTGNLDLMSSNYKIEYLQNDKEYLIKVFPLSTDTKKIMQEINIFLDKKDLSVLRLRMYETADRSELNYTEYRFTNKKMNVNIPKEQFALK